MLTELPALASQCWGTVLLRPYVLGFLAIFLVAARRDLGWPRTLGFLVWGWLMAFWAEYISTRIGLPFGLYEYTGDTRGVELFISNVPFFSPLSFPFLAYAAFCLARRVLGPRGGAGRAAWVRTVLLSGILMTLLDVVIDPLAVRGGRWFLGHIFEYPDGGVYFGVPLSNFLGWLVVGWVTVGGVLWARPDAGTGSPRAGIGLYYLVLIANLATTLWIGEVFLAGAGIVVHLVAFLLLYSVSRVTASRWASEHLPVPVVIGERAQRPGLGGGG